jgi:acyl-CoA thioesterase
MTQPKDFSAEATQRTGIGLAAEGDELSAEASELWRSGRSGLYEITVTNQRGERIALFRGRSHRVGGSVTAG